MHRIPLFRSFLIALAVVVLWVPGSTSAQDEQHYSQDELDQLLAPIALYPDQLLTQALIASTYPLEVVEAARFLQANPSLKGAALDDAISARNWDPSVQSLTAFPQVLAMMNDKLEWTERLGNAFLADEQRVMDTVQSLRRRAEAAGNLASMPQQTVVDRDNVIAIEPSQPDVVYVPAYDPLTIYGPWWAPGYLPWYWYPPPIYGYPVIFTGIAFGIGWGIGSNHWGWCHPNWRGHQIVLNTGHNRFWDRPNRPPPPPGQGWQHSPYHRRGVPYGDASTQQRFRPTSPDAIHQRQNYRGYPAPPAQRGTGEPARVQAAPGLRSPPAATPPVQSPASIVRPAQPPAIAQRPAPVIRQAPVAPSIGTQRSSPSIFDPGSSRSQAQTNAQRGAQSLRTAPPPAPPIVRPPPAQPAPATRAPVPARPMPAAPSRGH